VSRAGRANRCGILTRVRGFPHFVITLLRTVITDGLWQRRNRLGQFTVEFADNLSWIFIKRIGGDGKGGVPEDDICLVPLSQLEPCVFNHHGVHSDPRLPQDGPDIARGDAFIADPVARKYRSRGVRNLRQWRNRESPAIWPPLLLWKIPPQARDRRDLESKGVNIIGIIDLGPAEDNGLAPCSRPLHQRKFCL